MKRYFFINMTRYFLTKLNNFGSDKRKEKNEQKRMTSEYLKKKYLLFDAQKILIGKAARETPSAWFVLLCNEKSVR